jgi:hypothetical protein
LTGKALAGIPKITRRYLVWKIERKGANYDDNCLLCNFLFILCLLGVGGAAGAEAEAVQEADGGR